MSNTQLIIFICTILGSQWASLLYLSNRIDRVEDKLTAAINQLGLKIDRVLDTLHDHDKRLVEVERK